MRSRAVGISRREVLARGARLGAVAVATPAMDATVFGAAPPPSGRTEYAWAADGPQTRAPRVVAVFGSGRRRGASETAGEHLLGLLEKRGLTVRRFHLTEMDYAGCRGCMLCKTSSDRCVVQDDLTPVLEEIRGADALVLASSIYFGEISAQTKGLIDRMYSFYHPEFWNRSPKSRLQPGKKLVLVLMQGNADAGLFAGIGPRYAGLLSGEFGFIDVGLVRGVGIRSVAELERRPEVTATIEAAAARLLETLSVATAG